MLHKLLSSTDTLKLKSKKKKKKKYCKAGPRKPGNKKNWAIRVRNFSEPQHYQAHDQRAQSWRKVSCSLQWRVQGSMNGSWNGSSPILGNFACLVSTFRTKGGCLCGICLCPRTLLNPALRLSQSKLPASSWCFSQYLPPKQPTPCWYTPAACRLGLSQSSLPQGIDYLGPLRLSLLPPSKTLSQTTPDMCIMCAWCNVIWRTLHHLRSSLSKSIEPESKGVFISNHWLAENMGAGQNKVSGNTNK